MSLWRNLIRMLFRATQQLRHQPRRPFVRKTTRHDVLSPNLEVHYTGTPPHLRQSAQPNPAFIAQTLAKALKNRAAAVALVQDGNHNRYLVSINVRSLKTQAARRH
jgi:hypothetical protein